MKNKLKVFEKTLEGRVVAILRKIDTTKAVPLAEALIAGGISSMEVTMDTKGALQAIADIRLALGDKAVVGAGTVLDATTARMAILGGAEFLVAPNVDAGVINMGHRYNVPVMPGCMSPTEIQRAYELGCDIVKVFPASVVGPSFFKSVKGPLDYVTLMATGGVSVSNAQEFRQNGADILGVGGNLVDAKLVAAERFAEITVYAKEIVEKAR